MKFISKIVFSLISNLLSLLVAAYFVKGFIITRDPKNLLIVGLIFTAINFLIKPILKLILSPIIFITLGFGLILVNAIILYMLEYFSKNVSINDVASLIYASLIISGVNLVFHFLAKHSYRE